MLGAVSSDAVPQSSSELLSDPTPFEIAYGMSFYDFDACGDSEAGRIFRRAIIEKLELCPFSPEAKTKFEEWRTETLEGLLSQLLSNQDGRPVGPPEVSEPTVNPNGAPMTCDSYRNTQRYLERRADLLRYSRSEITVDRLFGEDCPSGPVSL
jgi:hypothetical protein